jgi:hypothetical protein
LERLKGTCISGEKRTKLKSNLNMIYHDREKLQNQETVSITQTMTGDPGYYAFRAREVSREHVKQAT